MIILKRVFLLLVLLPNSTWAEQYHYQIDTAHSVTNWEVRNVVGLVAGTFHDIRGTITIDKEQLADSKVEATIDVYSLTTGHHERDAHLLSSDFFDVLKYSTIHFISNKVTPRSKEKAIVEGELTIHGITSLVEFPIDILGFAQDKKRQERVGFEANTTLKRGDYGITLGLNNIEGMVGNEVQITLLIEAVKTNTVAINQTEPLSVVPKHLEKY